MLIGTAPDGPGDVLSTTLPTGSGAVLAPPSQTIPPKRPKSLMKATYSGPPEWTRPMPVSATTPSTLHAFGKLDVLVNNAAFQEHAMALEDISEEHFDMTMRTNIYGYFHMAKAALPHMKPGSSIVNSGSETGIFGHKMLLDYSATKGAIHAFTKALATNVISRGIRVNAVAPGPVWTPLNPADQPVDEVKQFGQSTDMKRPAQPEEVSPAYVFLASPVCASYITGIVLPVMGGVTGSV